ncbi:NUDIX hydrolase [Myxococcus landrumensis]|uniref:NUDIX domain-containing protein n=1 Tax=Myxococcus landrumensis TaxID=2813577 RepID=A0ABX7NGL6_9BACT|nr:NUDIX domain-containing protein [Myxococcus landrumus]QSQ17548.1 NUDIX domain-containing protein [Myxococcus landrumus]
MEQMDVIDAQGRVVGRAAREAVYGQKLPHRIVHVMVEHEGKVFLQRRSLQMKFMPGHLCTSAGGHVDAGEAPLDAARRELREELGLDSPLSLVAEFVFDDGHHRRIFLYRTKLDGAMRFSEREVGGGLFLAPEELGRLRDEPCHPQLLPCLEQMFPASGGSARP